MKVGLLDPVLSTRTVDDVNSSLERRLREVTDNYDDYDAFISEDSFDNNKQKDKNTQNQPKTFKGGVAGVWKFFSVANTMVNATLKGLFYGALTGFTVLTGAWAFKSLPKAFSKEGASIWQTVRHPLNNISKSGKVTAGIASGVVLAYHLIKGKLTANQNTAVIDHKMKVGHRDK